MGIEESISLLWIETEIYSSCLRIEFFSVESNAIQEIPGNAWLLRGSQIGYEHYDQAIRADAA